MHKLHITMLVICDLGAVLFIEYCYLFQDLQSTREFVEKSGQSPKPSLNACDIKFQSNSKLAWEYFSAIAQDTIHLI